MILLRLLLLLALCGAAHGTPSKCGESCGLWPMRSTTRIVGGVDVQPGIGAWAGIVSIRNLLSEEWTTHVCGGTLIRPKWVLTAAHCFLNRTTPLSKWAVVAGATRIGEMGPHVQVRRIKKVHIHELYDGHILYDIAVVELKQPMGCTPSIQLACLPGPTVRVSSQHCYIAGWGDTYAKSPNPIVLKQSGALLIDTQLCNSSDWYGGRIQDYNLCAGYPEGGMSTCQIISHIVGGTGIPPGSSAGIVSIWDLCDPGTGHICPIYLSIVSPQRVLTAAHCFISAMQEGSGYKDIPTAPVAALSPVLHASPILFPCSLPSA
ncbi:Acrosin [Pitangus sulphuratus]|nr:Acrosin [Pitangus sulphuratus]